MDIAKILKENIIFLVLVVAVIVGAAWWAGTEFQKMTENRQSLTEQQAIVEQKKRMLEEMKAKAAREEKKEEKKSKSGKVIYEVLDQQFSAEASFGIMFENIIANITNSGLRIRSIDYNYKPHNDDILNANAPGYNACELRFKTVGTYSQLQGFLKNMAKETYLTNLHEIYIEPFEKDKTILIATFSLRLYTKTI